MWLVQGFVRCSFDDAVDVLTKLFANGLGLRDERQASRPPG